MTSCVYLLLTSLHCTIIKVDKEETLFEQEIYHGSTVDLIPPLYGGKSKSKDKDFLDWVQSWVNHPYTVKNACKFQNN